MKVRTSYEDRRTKKLNNLAVNLLIFMKNKEIRFAEEEIITWISFYDVDEFCRLFTAGLFDDGGLDIKLQQYCIALDLKKIVDYYFIGEENEYIIEKLKQISKWKESRRKSAKNKW